MLSIVVPIYNVAPYLDECLSSIAAQYRDNLEVILVDDGSTDDSGEIAARFAESDGRFKLVRKANAGLGAARNTGTGHATGEYLMFVDSDDVLPPYAAELLVGTLEKTGSDFSCGNVLRLHTKGLVPSGLHRVPFAETKLRTHVRKLPALLADRTAWNKVYRRSFWDEHAFVFPEGVLYEDIPVTVPAHVLAKQVDVIDVPIYYWREREGEDKSITQRRGELPAFLDRLNNCWGVSKLLGEQGNRQMKQQYDESVLKSDLMLFVRELPNVDDEYRRVFLERTNEYLDTVDDAVIPELPVHLRVVWTLIRRRMMPELLELVPRLKAKVPITRRGLRRYHNMELFAAGLPQLPPELFLAGTPRPRTKVHSMNWEDGKLRIRGHAFIPGQAASRPWSTSRLFWLKETGGARTKRTPLVNRRCADATADFGTATTTYDWSGFDLLVDPQALRGKDGDWHDGDWSIVIGVFGIGRKSKGSLEMGQNATPIPLPSHQVSPDVRITPFLDNTRVRLLVEHTPARLTGLRHTGDQVEIEGLLRRGGDGPVARALNAADAKVSARLSRIDGLLWQRYPVEVDGDTFRFRIPADDLRRPGAEYPPLRVGEPTDRWKIELAASSKAVAEAGGKRTARIPVWVPAEQSWDPLELGGRIAHLHPTRQGHPVLAALPTGPTVTDVSTSARTYRLAGRIPPGSGDWSQMRVVLRLSNNRETKEFPATVNGESWSLMFDPDAVPSFGGHVRLRSGTWNLLCRNADGPILPLPSTGAAVAALPLGLAGDSPRVSLEWFTEERVVLRVRSAIPDDQRGRANATRLREEFYPESRHRPLRDTVLYNSFTGRQYSDSPRAVHEEIVSRGLRLEHLWVSVDGQAPVPDTAEEVPLWSLAWYDALATARYIVTNQHLPEWFRRRPGQVVIQTWHGTPLKRIGFDIADVQFTDRRYLEKLEAEAPNWTHLVSPNTFSSPILRRAFKYEGELMEIGYPRNDVLFRDRAEITAKVRAAVGVPAGKKLVLYAPTWRDDESAGGVYRISMRIDVQDAAAKLGDDHVLLVRRHPNVLDEIPGVGDGFVFDVSQYPDMADLLAAADVLITDYSSVMFDFANTGRPMLFFTYDLAHYRDTLRGFYFDFEAEAPGPLLSTSEEVVAAIRDVDRIAGEYADRYAAFRAKACDLDDGHAAAALVDRMLAAGS